HVAIVPTPNGTAELDLVLRLGADAQRPHAELSYRSDLFDETTIHRFAGDLTALLAAASANPCLRDPLAWAMATADVPAAPITRYTPHLPCAHAHLGDAAGSDPA